VGRHANGDTPTGVLFVKPDDPKFRRAAGGRRTGKIPRIKPPTSDSGFLPTLPPPAEAETATAMIPAQRRAPERPAPRVAVSVAVPAQRPHPQRPPVQHVPAQHPPVSAPPKRVPQPVPMRLAPPPMRSMTPSLPETVGASLPRQLPTWTKVCIVLGVLLVIVGFGGLGAAYAMNGSADARSAGNELIQR